MSFDFFTIWYIFILEAIIYPFVKFCYYTEILRFKETTIKSSIKSIAIGGFDGMHIAHRKLFSHLCPKGAVVVIQTSYANLSPKDHRSRYTNFPLFYYPLENIKSLSGEEFIKLLKEEFPSLEKIVVGYDFHFGYKAACGTQELKELFKGEVIVVDEYKFEGVSVHSRVIREYLREGNINGANKLLGREYLISGFSVKGQGLGKKKFVPTINIEVEDFLLPKEGVYITATSIKDDFLPSITFVGHRVSTDGKYAVETHILEDFDQNLPYKFLDIKFYENIRENKKFDSYDDLKKEITEDIKQARNYFKSF